MPNLYSCTRLDRFTRGTINRKLKAKDRNPHYYEYADNPAQAEQQLQKVLDTTEAIEAVLVKKNAQRPFFANPSITDLTSGAKPVNDLSVFAGGIPDDEDVDVMLKDIYDARKAGGAE